ncbi:MAG: 2-oxoacid:acceptor oxidoreductase family protein [Thermodesulfobacteriota bacterium]
MRSEIVFAGFGGQGVIKAALLLAEAAGLIEGKEVAQTQSYGPEARGGACRSEVVISDREIDYLKTLRTDCFVVMSQPALDKYQDKLDPESSVVIADTTLVTNRPPGLKKVFSVRATEIAEKELGRSLFANIIMLGVFAGITRLVAVESLKQALAGNVPEKTLAWNVQALDRGFQIGSRLRSKSESGVV